jgi:carbonic anhydrase
MAPTQGRVRYSAVMQSLLLTLLVAARVFADDAVCPAEWGYGENNGPARWGQMREEWATCDSGVQQSPIDLDTSGNPERLPALTLRYVNGPLVVQNTAVELKVPTARGTLSYGTEVVNAPLTQLHFHARPEHTVDGKSPYAAEIHFVHQLPNKRTYVVAVFIEARGETPNVALQQILDLKPATACSSRRRDENFNPQGLLPSTATFWTYSGSLTTPACGEGVMFFVLREPLIATKAQTDALSVGVDNVRPTQGVGTRSVRKNF